jgi:hypothetical protein
MIFILSIDNWLPLPDTLGCVLEKKGDIVVETSYSIEDIVPRKVLSPPHIQGELP